jgi:creatinine amidohydrolase
VLPLGDAVIYGPMSGGIAISPATHKIVIKDVVSSLHRNGLSRFVTPSLYLWRIAYGMLRKIVGPETAAKVSGHGADPLTSLGLHPVPELLRTDMVPAGQPIKRDPVLDLPFTGLGTASFAGAGASMPNEYDEVYNLGVAKGDPNLSSAETGAKLAEEVTEVCAKFVVHFAEIVPA